MTFRSIKLIYNENCCGDATNRKKIEIFLVTKSQFRRFPLWIVCALHNIETCGTGRIVPDPAAHRVGRTGVFRSPKTALDEDWPKTKKPGGQGRSGAPG